MRPEPVVSMAGLNDDHGRLTDTSGVHLGAATMIGRRSGAVATIGVQVRLSRWWRFYRLRLGTALVGLAAGVVVYSAAVFTPERRWFDEVSAPLNGTGLSRVASSVIVGPELLPQRDPLAPEDARTALIVAADGTPLLGERLVRFVTDREAELAIEHALAHNSARSVVGADGFHDVSVGCPAGCRPARIGRHGDIVILLARLSAPGSSDTVEGDRALAAVARRYADRVGLDRVRTRAMPRALEVLVAAAGVALLFVPFAIWHGVVARRAPRTPHRHVADARAPPPPVVDVCAVAAAARSRGRRLFAAEVAVFVGCGIVAVLDEQFTLFVVVAPPLSWIIMRLFGVRKTRAPSRQAEVGVVRWGRLWLEGLALRFAGIYLTAVAWIAGAGIVYAMPASILSELSESNPFGIGSLRDGQDVALFALDNVAIWFVLLFFMGGMSAISRLARRLRVLAASRDQERHPRPVLLYLRAFDDDPRMLAAGDFGRRSATEIFSFRARMPFEEIVVRELVRHGLVVAIAEPGTPMLFLPLGASRKRLPQREWQEAVRAQMREAALIVIAVGTTEGLLWEMATATRQGLLDRVLLIVPPNDDDEIRARWHASAGTIAVAGGPTLDLPVDPATTLVVRVGSDGVHKAVVADRRDEHTYATAIARTVAGYGGPIARVTRATVLPTLPGSSATYRPRNTLGYGHPGWGASAPDHAGAGGPGYFDYEQFDPVTGEPLSDKSKLVAGLLGISLGGFGAGRFYIGDNKTGVLQLVITLLTCGLGWLWGLIDGILILVNGGYDAQGRKLRDL
jgi:TM2 domain-containing membrane protein YozV